MKLMIPHLFQTTMSNLTSLIVDSLVDSIIHSLSYFLTERTVLRLLSTMNSFGDTHIHKLEYEARNCSFLIQEKILNFKTYSDEPFFTTDSKAKLSEFIKLPNMEAMFASPKFQQWFLSEVQSHMKNKVEDIIQSLLTSPEATKLIDV